jgi:hypothetical protein
MANESKKPPAKDGERKVPPTKGQPIKSQPGSVPKKNKTP